MGNPNDKKTLAVNISPRAFKKKTDDEIDALISEQVVKQMNDLGLNITADDIAKAKLEVNKPAEKKPVEKKPEEKKPAAKKPEEKKPEEKKPEEKKPAEKKSAEKKPEEKKPAEKKPAEKKPAEEEIVVVEQPEVQEGNDDFLDTLDSVQLTVVEIHDQIVKQVHNNILPGNFSKFTVDHINPNDKKTLAVN